MNRNDTLECARRLAKASGFDYCLYAIACDGWACAAIVDKPKIRALPYVSDIVRPDGTVQRLRSPQSARRGR